MFSIKFEALTKGEKIGEGGFGIVYKGTYRFGPAAIKQLQMDDLSPEAEAEFTKEAKIMAELHHPNVIHFYGYCTVPRCLVMEYMPKGSLFKVLHNKREPLDWNIRIHIATGIASGLAFLHSKQIWHRDIKSLNVLLDAQMGARLTDFGLSQVKNETKSKAMASKTNHQDAVGTVQWMAPELFKRKAVFTQKSDIYSFGITLWELVSRKIPYASDTQAAIPTFVQQGEREDIPSDCPPKLAHIIQRCWAGDPEERPTASEVATFMTTDAKTLGEQAAADVAPVSAGYQLTSDAGYQVTSQIASDFAPAPVTLHASVANLKLQSGLSQRRVGEKLNLRDKKEKQEKMQYVLEQSQFQEFAKSAPKENVSDSKELQEFLRFVAEGEQSKAEAMLKSNLALVLLSGDVTDLSKRKFTGITGFQYAVWALDWHMWTMMRKYLPDEAAQEQAKGFETGSWVRQHGIHAQHLLDNLVKALQVTIDLDNAKKRTECDTAWVQQVGGAQLLLPVHVVNEYCHSTRPFYPCPNFKKKSLSLPRNRTIKFSHRSSSEENMEWFTASYDRGKLGETFAVDRGYHDFPALADDFGRVNGEEDRDSVRALTSARTAQREELIAELKPRRNAERPAPANNFEPAALTMASASKSKKNSSQNSLQINANDLKTMSLIEAIKENNQTEVFRLLRLKTNKLGEKIVDEVDAEYGGDALYWAATFGRIHFIEPLLKVGANVNKQDKDGRTPIYKAAQNGHAKMITTLKAAGANVDTPHDGRTPGYVAAQQGHVAAMTALLEAGADASTKTPWGTALERARRGKEPGHLEIVRILEAHFKQYPTGVKPVRITTFATLVPEGTTSGLHTFLRQAMGRERETGRESEEERATREREAREERDRNAATIRNALGGESALDVPWKERERSRNGSTDVSDEGDEGDEADETETDLSEENRAPSSSFEALAKRERESYQGLFRWPDREEERRAFGHERERVPSREPGSRDGVTESQFQALARREREGYRGDRDRESSRELGSRNGVTDTDTSDEVDEADEADLSDNNSRIDSRELGRALEEIRDGEDGKQGDRDKRKTVGTNVNRPYAGKTQIYIAAVMGDAAAIAALHAAGAKVNTYDDRGRTPVYVAAEKGHVAVIAALHAAGANMDRPNRLRGATPVYIAAEKGHAAAIVALKAAGANVNTPDNDGRTPVWIAAAKGHAAAIVALKAAGANVNTPDNDGRTPIRAAALHAEAITALKAAGANVDVPNTDGKTPIHIAVHYGKAKAVRALHAAGAKMSTLDKDGRTVLHIVVADKYNRLNVETIIALRSAGVNVDTQMPDGRTPLHIAAEHGKVQAISALLQAGADASIKTGWFGSTALDIANKKKEELKKKKELEKTKLAKQTTLHFYTESDLEKDWRDHEHYRDYQKVVRLLETHFEQYPKGIKPVTVMSNEVTLHTKLPSSLEQKNPPRMLTQFKQTTKPVSKVNARDLRVFLRLVAEGEQDKAEVMLKSNPALALVPGDVTDLSKRTFKGITAFQYAVWALDWHMWTMIRKYLSDDKAREQTKGFETGSWVKQHGVYFNLNILIQAYETTSALYDAQKWSEGNTAWVQQVGGAQLLLPAHVINEYCHPTRAFYPLPNFKDGLILPRSRKIDEGEWFTAVCSGGKLGEKFACYRGGLVGNAGAGTIGRAGDSVRRGDRDCVRELTIARTTQREELINELKPRSVQKQAT